MSQVNINRVVITGNLTADPDLRTLQSGTSVCKLRVACNTRRKDSASDKWVDKPNYFDVTVWGSLGETVAKYTAKGRPVAIDGRLEWREWDTDDGAKRQAVEIIADSVQFIGRQTANGTTEPEA
jgi:single-strand DNA-binding protein